MLSLRAWRIIKLTKEWNKGIFHSNKNVKEVEKVPKSYHKRQIKNFNDWKFGTNKSVSCINKYKIFIEIIFINNYETPVFIMILIYT